MTEVASSSVSFQKNVFRLLEKASGNANILTTPHAFLKYFKGDHAKSMFFSQILYWSDKSKRRDGYFYKSYEEWEKELFLTPYQVRKYTKELKLEGLIVTKIKKANNVPTVHYHVNYKRLFQWIVKNFDNGLLNDLTMESEYFSQSITETNAEITQKNSIYLPSGRDNKFFTFYLSEHKRILGKEHVRITKKSLEIIEEEIIELEKCCIEYEDWQEQVTLHLTSLPKSNNGSILAFLKAKFRYFS